MELPKFLMESQVISTLFSLNFPQALMRGCERFVGASGGNAGVALARAARILNVPATVYVPETASPMVIKKLQQDGAVVKVTVQQNAMPP